MKNTVMITGCSSGIGKETAIYFHDRGWNVAATMRHPEKEQVLPSYTNMRCIQLDVTDAASIKNAIDQAYGVFNKVDVLVNCAGYTLVGPFEAATAAQIQALFDVNVFGVMNVTREILPYFRKAGRGTIINISSLGGRVGVPLSSFYASAKWSLEGYSESVRFELNSLGIKVKIVEPGAIDTNFAANAILVRKSDVPSYERTLDGRLAKYEARRNLLSDPVVVAKVIYKAATDNNTKLRYLAGRDAKLFWALKSILPFGMFSALLKKISS